MGTVRADNFSDGAGTGAPDFSSGLQASGGISGVTDGSTASAGKVGEYKSSSVTNQSATTSLVSKTTLTLEDGDWLVWAGCSVSVGGTTPKGMRISLVTGSGSGGLEPHEDCQFPIVRTDGGTTDQGGGSLPARRISVTGGAITLHLNLSCSTGTIGTSVQLYAAALRIR